MNLLLSDLHDLQDKEINQTQFTDQTAQNFIVAQQTIKSLQKRLSDFESQQGFFK